MTEERIVERDDVDYLVEEVKSASKVVGLAPTRFAKDLDSLMEIVEPEDIFKLAYRQIKTDHKNLVRAKFNGKGKSAIAVVAALASGTIDTEQIKAEMQLTGSDFTTAATNLLTTDPDPEAIHWDIL